MSRIEGNQIIRFDRHIRLQHFVMMLSFVALVVTGLPQTFSEGPVMRWWLDIFRGVENMRIAHHWAARAFYITYFYHLFYLGYAWLFQHKSPWTICPALKDIKDAFQTILYIFGLAEEPVYDYLQYGQKIDYWFTLFLVPIIALSGLTIGNEYTLEYLPGWVLAIALVTHRGSIFLAIGFVIIVHLYYGHLAPKAFPLNPVIFTGKMTTEKYKQWFYLDYLKLIKKSNKPAKKE